MEKNERFLPFVETSEFYKIAEACDQAITRGIISLLYGLPGVGKTLGVWHHVQSQSRMISNGRHPYHHFHIAQSEKTDRGILNALIASITGEKRPNLYSGPAMERARDLWKKFGYKLLIIDEVWALQHSGLEAVRTLHDSGPAHPRIPIVLVTVPYVVRKIENGGEIYEAFNSRVNYKAQIFGLTKADIRLVLENLPPGSPLVLDAKQPDPKKLIDKLYTVAGGGEKSMPTLRALDNLLRECDLELRSQIIDWRELPPEDRPPKPGFNIELINTVLASRIALTKRPPETQSSVEVG